MMNVFHEIFDTLEFKAEISKSRYDRESAGLYGNELISYIEEKMPEYELWRNDLMGQLGAFGKRLDPLEKNTVR